MHHLVFLLLLCAAFPPSGAVDLQRRIYGGGECDKGDRLYHVKVLSQDSKGKTYLCGGSLIHKQWILTAAHCKEKKMSAVLGVHPGSGTTVEIKDKPIIHKKDDIMLLKLPVETNLPHILLPRSSCPRPAEGTTVQVAGYGTCNKNINKKKEDEASDKLLCADMIIINCERYMNFIQKFIEMLTFPKTNHFCGRVDYITDAGKGDSGGGVIYDGKIYGVIVAGGKYVCESPPVFVDVCSNLEWIDKYVPK